MIRQKIKVVLLDYDPIQRKQSIKFIQRTAPLKLISASTNAQQALSSVFNSAIDLLIIDQALADQSLEDFLLQIKYLLRGTPQRRPLRVMVTSPNPIKETAIMQKSDLTYLHKPYDYEAFLQAIHHVLDSWDSVHIAPLPFDQIFLVATPNSIQRVKISFDTIAYVEADGMQCIIWQSDKEHYTANKPMGTVLTRLPEALFKQCHRSYAVNVNYVTHVEQNKVQLYGVEKPIPIGSRKIHVEFDFWDRTNSL